MHAYGLSAVAAAFTFSDLYRVWVGVLALIVAILSSIGTFLNPNERMTRHHLAGNRYDALSTKSRMFWTIECWREGSTEQVLTEKLQDLCEDKNKLNQESPQVTQWAYKRGKKGIEEGETIYLVDNTSKETA